MKRSWREFVLENLVVVFSCLALYMYGLPNKHRQSNVEPQTQSIDQSTEQYLRDISKDSAIQIINGILQNRMSYLDSARRAQLSRAVFEESMFCGFDPLFVLAVAEVESRWDHEAVSPTGARGLYQILPTTWRWETKRRGFGVFEKFNPVHNARVGIGYLCYLSATFKRPESILLAYNQGPGGATAIIRGLAEPSAEATGFASTVLKSYRKLLAEQGLPNDMAHMRQLFQRPMSTIYTPLTCEGSPLDRPAKISKKRCGVNSCGR